MQKQKEIFHSHYTSHMCKTGYFCSKIIIKFINSMTNCIHVSYVYIHHTVSGLDTDGATSGKIVHLECEISSSPPPTDTIVYLTTDSQFTTPI